MSIIDSLTRFFAPDDCLACGREGPLLCRDCVATLPPLPQCCFTCYAATAGLVCENCLATTDCNTMQVACHYSGTALQLVAQLKFAGNQSAASVLARAMLRRCPKPPSATLITHVPATPAHIRERGYDQAALIARELARAYRLPRKTLLKRSGRHHQLGADRRQRVEQLQGAIRAINRTRIKNAHVLLVDDVVTTGASVRVASQTLLGAGAASVDVVVFAQALR